MQVKETRYANSLRRALDARAASRNASNLPTHGIPRRGCTTGYCTWCAGNRTFSRNLPMIAAIAESLAGVADTFEHTFEMVSIPAMVAVGNINAAGKLMVGADLTTVATVSHDTGDGYPVVSCYDICHDVCDHTYDFYFEEK